MRARAEGLRRLDDDGDERRIGSSQGGPTQSGPIRTGLWNARQRSDQSGRDVLAGHLAEVGAQPRLAVRVGVRGELDHPVALQLLEAGRGEVEERRAGDLRLGRRHAHGHAAQAQRNVLFSRAKKP